MEQLLSPRADTHYGAHKTTIILNASYNQQNDMIWRRPHIYKKQNYFFEGLSTMKAVHNKNIRKKLSTISSMHRSKNYTK